MQLVESLNSLIDFAKNIFDLPRSENSLNETKRNLALCYLYFLSLVDEGPVHLQSSFRLYLYIYVQRCVWEPICSRENKPIPR